MLRLRICPHGLKAILVTNMFSTSTIVILILTTSSIQGDCGSRPTRQARIVGGKNALVNAWPWQVMLRSKTGNHFCGGTLVDPHCVVTAGHCVNITASANFTVRLGAHSLNESVGIEQDIDVAQIFVHKYFNKPLQYSNDVALLKLAKPAQLNKDVGVACLPDFHHHLSDNKTCWITGWGTTAFEGNKPNQLQEASVPLVLRERCTKAYPCKIDSSMLCAGFDHGGIDSCSGDSGGPLVCEFNGKWYLEGIISWGDTCALPNKYGVYANVRSFVQWIKNTCQTGTFEAHPVRRYCTDWKAKYGECDTCSKRGGSPFIITRECSIESGRSCMKNEETESVDCVKYCSSVTTRRPSVILVMGIIMSFSLYIRK